MAKSDTSWSPTATDFDWIESTGRPPHPVLVEMETAAEPERIPILSRDSGRLLGALAAGRRRAAFAGPVPALAGPFDLVFIDALKDEYLAYLTALMDRLEPGAIVVADNVLWSGRTSGSRPALPGDGTEALREFCARVSADPAFEATILPIGDGLLVATLRP